VYDRESVYRFLWDSRDYSGKVALKQGEVAAELGISYQAFSEIMREFVEMGLVDKTRHQFTPKYNPDKIPWDGAYIELRKRYVAQKDWG